MTERSEAALAAAAMTGLGVLLTWPLALHLGEAFPGDLADPVLAAFILGWDASRAATGFGGLWNAPIFFPLHDTLAFAEHLLGIAVFTTPIQWLSGNAVLAYNLAFIGTYALAGLGAFLLARSLWRSGAAAWVAGVAFAAAPSRAIHVSHLQLLTAGWLALALWGLHQYFATRSRRALGVFAVCYALLALSSSYFLFFASVPVALALAAGLWWLVRSQRKGPGAVGTVLLELTAAALAVALAFAPVAMAYLRVRKATGLRRSAAESALFSARWSDFASIPPGLHAWSGVLPTGVPERMLFPGLAVLLLAAVAVTAQAGRLGRAHDDGRGWAVWLCAASLGACVWLALGPAAGLYRWTAALVPGLDGLRVPARFILVAVLPLALLAARGVQVLGRSGVVPVSVLAVVVIVVEGFSAPLPLAPFDARQRERAGLNAWLGSMPPGGLLELPIAGPQFQPFTTSYQFNTLFHGHPIVNGYSGTGYGLQDFLGSPTSPIARLIELPAALRGLRSVGVRYVVLHRAAYEKWTRWNPEPFAAAMDAENSQVDARAQFGDAIAWKLTDAPAAAAPSLAAFTRLPSGALAASASHDGGDVRLALDGRLDTRWTTGGPQQGDEWFQVTFARETDVAAIVFRTDRTGHTDRPRRLVVESVDEVGVVRVLFDDSLVPSMITALANLADGTALGLPPNRTRSLRLRQTGTGGRVPWSIYELEIRARTH